MPLRIASLARRLESNGKMLHQAMVDRVRALGANHEPSEAEQALVEERRLLKEERTNRRARAHQPKATAVDKLVRTHRAQAKEKKPKTTKEPKVAKAGTAHRPSRAEKHAAKAAALDAARRSSKKSAKT